MADGIPRNHLPPQVVDEKHSLNPYPLYHLQNPPTKASTHILIGAQSITLPQKTFDESSNPATSVKPGHSSSSTQHQPLHGNNKLAKLTFSEVLKGHTEVSKHLPPPSITLMPTAEFEGKPSVIFPISEKNMLVEKLKFVLVGKFSHGRPSWIYIQDFFVKLKPTGIITTSIFDKKHIFIECSNKSDYYRLWLKLVWKIGGFNMRVFKWTSNFSAKMETSIAPVWVRFEGLPLYMFEERSLFSVANCIGKPVKIDSRNLQRTMLNSARVCVELDSSQPLVEDVWISFEDAQTKKPVEGFWVKVFYDEVPQYCHYCCHIGHGNENCKRRIENSTSQARHSIGEVKVSAAHVYGVKPSYGAQIDENMKGKFQLEGMLANQFIETVTNVVGCPHLEDTSIQNTTTVSGKTAAHILEDSVVNGKLLVTRPLERQDFGHMDFQLNSWLEGHASVAGSAVAARTVGGVGAAVAARAVGGVGEPARKADAGFTDAKTAQRVLLSAAGTSAATLREATAMPRSAGKCPESAGDLAAQGVLEASVSGDHVAGVSAVGEAGAWVLTGVLRSQKLAGENAAEHNTALQFPGMRAATENVGTDISKGDGAEAGNLGTLELALEDGEIAEEQPVLLHPVIMQRTNSTVRTEEHRLPSHLGRFGMPVAAETFCSDSLEHSEVQKKVTAQYKDGKAEKIECLEGKAHVTDSSSVADNDLVATGTDTTNCLRVADKKSGQIFETMQSRAPASVCEGETSAKISTTTQIGADSWAAFVERMSRLRGEGPDKNDVRLSGVITPSNKDFKSVRKEMEKLREEDRNRNRSEKKEKSTKYLFKYGQG